MIFLSKKYFYAKIILQATFSVKDVFGQKIYVLPKMIFRTKNYRLNILKWISVPVRFAEANGGERRL